MLFEGSGLHEEFFEIVVGRGEQAETHSKEKTSRGRKLSTQRRLFRPSCWRALGFQSLKARQGRFCNREAKQQTRKFETEASGKDVVAAAFQPRGRIFNRIKGER